VHVLAKISEDAIEVGESAIYVNGSNASHGGHEANRASIMVEAETEAVFIVVRVVLLMSVDFGKYVADPRM